MPWTLYRFIVTELLKLLALSAIVLVLLVSTAAAIKPLIDGILDPASLAMFIGFTSPTMLQFALPFAAAFAATLVFSRMTADNEIMACSAGGLSYLSILLPVLYLGMLLMLGLFHLSNTVAPNFNQRAASVLQKDLIRVMVNQLQRGQAFKSGKTVIYADTAEEHEPTAEEIDRVMAAGSRLPPFRTITLRNVAVSILGDQSQVVREGTARTANIFMFRDGRKTLATAYLQDVSYFDAQRGDLLYMQQSEWVALPIDSPLRDKPQFLTRAQLRGLAENPEGFDKVARAKQRLVRAVARAELLANIDRGLQPSTGQSGNASVELSGYGEERYRLTAAQVRATEAGLDLTGGVRVELRRGAGVVRYFEARSALVNARQDEFDTEPMAMIELREARVVDPRLTGRGTEHASLMLPAARWPTPILTVHQQANLKTLEAQAAQQFGGDARVQKALNSLRHESFRLVRELTSQLHIRGASAVTCLLVLVLGAVLSMRLRGRSPLVVFFWSFMLTLAVVILTHTGRTVVMDNRLPMTIGAAAIWLGNAALLGVTTWQFLRLRRH